jgi:hypothetical protein
MNISPALAVVLLRCLIAALVLLPTASAQAAVGVNISPGWGGTVDGRDIPKMERGIADLRPDVLRLPWADNARVRETLRFAKDKGIQTVVIDDPSRTPEQIVSQVAAAQAAGLGVTAIEGQNEPDRCCRTSGSSLAGFPLPVGHGFSTTETTMSADRLAPVRDRQKRLYAAVAGRWRVLCPSAMYKSNEAALNALPCDIANAHRYPDRYGAPPKPAQAAGLPDVGKPVWVTETGAPNYKKWSQWPLSSHWQVDEAKQRDHLVQFIGMLRAAGAARVIVYSLQNPCSDDFDPGCNWGLYRSDGRPKLAAAALRG